jgi:hypothetical protein
VGSRSVLGDVKRKFLTLPGLELRTLRRPVRSQPLDLRIILKFDTVSSELLTAFK